MQSPHNRQDGAGPLETLGAGGDPRRLLRSTARPRRPEPAWSRPLSTALAHGLQLRSGAAQRSPSPPGLHQGKNTPAGPHPLCTNKSARPQDSGLCLSWHLCPKEPATHPGHSPPQSAAAVGRLTGRLRTRAGGARAATSWSGRSCPGPAALPFASVTTLPAQTFLRMPWDTGSRVRSEQTWSEFQPQLCSLRQ